RPSLDEIKAVWQNYTGSSIVRQLPSAPKHPVIYIDTPDRPQPRRDRMAGNGMSTVVGRLRSWALMDGGVQFVAQAHNTIRGAAGGSILNAELLAVKGYLEGLRLEELVHG
ncbi:MAG: aspartate-semialdehyde dehydrogenase, partial [Phototrophicales bacterium]